MPIATRIDCMECGGDAYLGQPLDDEVPIEAGDVLAYICRDCAHRADVVVEQEDLED